MKQAFTLSAVDLTVLKNHNVQHCNGLIPHTFHIEIPLEELPLEKIATMTVGQWGYRNIHRERFKEVPNHWLQDLITFGCDQTGIWSDVTTFANTEFQSFEMRLPSPSMNLRVILRKKGKSCSANIFITAHFLPEDLRNFWHSEDAEKYFEILHLFQIYAIPSQWPPKISVCIGEPWHVCPCIIGFKIFYETMFRKPNPIKIPDFYFGNKDSSWTLNISKISGQKIEGSKPIKETIKTPHGTFNITRPATKEEAKQQKKEAKKTRQEKLQNRIERQKQEMESLREQLTAAQKACALAAESSRQAANRQNRELEELQKKLERLKKSKESAIAMKDAEIDEIQKIADEIMTASEDAQKELMNADWQIQNLNAQVQGLRQRQSGSGIIAGPAQEQEKFSGEFEIALMSALHFAMDNAPIKGNSHNLRCRDIWQAFIQTNADAEQSYRNYKANTSNLLASIKKNNFWKSLPMLTPLGMSCALHTNNHGKIRFMDGDGRYSSVVSSTPSETASGPSNCAEDLKHVFLYY